MTIHRLSMAPLAALLVVFAGAPAPAWAANAQKLSDLVDARAAGGETQLEARGYVFIDGRPAYGGGKQSYYWHAGDRACVRVETADGRFRSITDATPPDCKQQAGAARGGDHNAAAAVVGAAIIAAALAHRSNGSQGNANHGSQFDLGYNDGIHNVPYHNPGRSDAYSQGYDEGVQQRERNTGHHSGRGGYAQAASFKDLEGESSIRAIDAMSERGFADADSFESGDTSYSIFYNRTTRQCVQLTMADGEVQSADDIQTHPKCR